MKISISELLNIIPEEVLICVQSHNEDILFCGARQDFNANSINALIVTQIYPESYGSYHGFHGITIEIER